MYFPIILLFMITFAGWVGAVRVGLKFSRLVIIQITMVFGGAIGGVAAVVIMAAFSGPISGGGAGPAGGMGAGIAMIVIWSKVGVPIGAFISLFVIERVRGHRISETGVGFIFAVVTFIIGPLIGIQLLSAVVESLSEPTILLIVIAIIALLAITSFAYAVGLRLVTKCRD